MTALLERVTAEIAAAPDSAGALTLYALVSTLQFERAGYLFKLIKLRDLSHEQRELAYALMELMAEGGNRGADWERAKGAMEAIVRGA